MCLILLAYKQHPDYPVILAANRDELFTRPTAKADFWDEYPAILAGRDLRQNGTWLGVDRRGRLAAVTNYRQPPLAKKDLVSRGLLVRDFLLANDSADHYVSSIKDKLDRYDGFNLFVGDLGGISVLSSHQKKTYRLEAGVHGISNGELDAAWPKVVKGKQALSAELDTGKAVDPENLLRFLTDSAIPDDNALPQTGVGLNLERRLAPVFVSGDDYGTRSSTVLIIDKKGLLSFTERSYDVDGNAQSTVHYEFQIG